VFWLYEKLNYLITDFAKCKTFDVSFESNEGSFLWITQQELESSG